MNIWMQKRNLPYRKSIRLKGWDYSNPGLYYVTICTKNSQHYFGEIRDDIMGLSVPGCIAWYFWQEIPDHHPNVELDEFVVMPNHLHGIVGIKSSKDESVRTLHATSLHQNQESLQQIEEESKDRMSEISPKAGSLSVILRSYKSAVTAWCNKNDHGYFAWHVRFYDHIIRNRKSLNRIREYIFNNPLAWNQDRENPDRIHEKGVEYMAAADSNY